MAGVTEFFTNSAAQSAPVKAPALAITKVGVAGGFIFAVLGGLAGLIGPLAGVDPVIATAVLSLAEKAILFAALVAVADILGRSATAILKAPAGEEKD